MQVRSIEVAFPDQERSNDDVLDLVRTHSADVFEGDLNTALEQIRFLLARTGAQKRRWFSPTAPLGDIVRDTVLKALHSADVRTDAVDFVIHAGVDRKFAEPSEAHFVAKLAGLDTAHCFDVLEACNSWGRATFLAHALLATGAARHIVVVTSDCNMTEGKHVYPTNFALGNMDELQWKFPSFTLGECVTATVLSASDAPWRFSNISRPALAPHCFVPLAGSESYLAQCDGIGSRIWEKGVFVSFGRLLHEEGAKHALAAFDALGISHEDVDVVIPHSSSRTISEQLAQARGLLPKTYSIYQTYGNVVSASLPVGLFEAARTGFLKRGDRVMTWMGAAGMSFSATLFEF